MQNSALQEINHYILLYQTIKVITYAPDTFIFILTIIFILTVLSSLVKILWDL